MSPFLIAIVAIGYQLLTRSPTRLATTPAPAPTPTVAPSATPTDAPTSSRTPAVETPDPRTVVEGLRDLLESLERMPDSKGIDESPIYQVVLGVEALDRHQLRRTALKQLLEDLLPRSVRSIYERESNLRYYFRDDLEWLSASQLDPEILREIGKIYLPEGQCDGLRKAFRRGFRNSADSLVRWCDLLDELARLRSRRL